MLCIWSIQKGVSYYELLKPGETNNGERYRQELIKLKRAIPYKRTEFAIIYKAIICHHDNARPHVAKPVKNYFKNSGWEICHNRLITQTLLLLITICFCRSRTPSLEYGSKSKENIKIWLNLYRRNSLDR